MRYTVIALILLFSVSIHAAEFIPKKLSQMTDDLGVGTHTADTSDPHGASMTQTNLTVGSLTVTASINLGTVTLSGYVKDNAGSATSTQLTSVQINSGTASLSAATIAGVSAPYPAQSSGTCTGLTANNTKLSGNTAIGTTTAATDVVDIDLGSGNMLIQSNSAYPQIQEIRGGAAADGNLLATRIYQGKDSAGNSTNYAGIYAISSNVTNGSETGSIDFYLSDASSYALRGRWKGANLGIGTTTPQTRLAINGDISAQSSGYLNFGAGSSSSGYGIRDNSGTIQYKNNTGTWTDIPSGSSGGGWIDNGTTITEITVTDQVVIGSTTAASNQILTVVGSQTTTDLNVKNAMSLAFTGTPTIDLAIGDNDTGLEQSSDNVIAIVVGGASTLVVDGSTNRVRIGTSTLNTTLQVGGTITAEGISCNGAGLTNVSVAFSAVTGSASSSQLPSIIIFPSIGTMSTANTVGQLYNYGTNTYFIALGTATGGVVTSDSGGSPGNAFDGTTTTAWETTSAPDHWIKYNNGTGTTKIYTRVRIDAYSNGGVAEIKGFRVDGSNNDSSWTTLYTGTHTSAANTFELFSFTNYVGYQYYRLYQTSLNWNGDNFWGAREIEFSSEGSAYTQYTLTYLDPVNGNIMMQLKSTGTLTSEASVIAFNATHSIFGSTTSPYSPIGQGAGGTTTTGYVIDASIGKVLALNYNSPSEEIKKVVYPNKGTRTNYIDGLKNIRIGEWSWRHDINRLDAEAIAKAKYVALNENDYIITSYDESGSSTIKIDSNALAIAKASKELEWASILNQSELITETENTLEAGKDRYLTPFAGDPTTPDILQSEDKRTLSLNSQIGYAYETIKDLIDLIGSLTARIEILENK